MRLAVAPLAALLVLVAAGGCGGDDEAASDPSAVEGVPWVLVSGVDVDGWEASAPSISFGEDGTASGSSGCNQWGGSYTFDGDTVELGEIAMTSMGCPPPADEVERAYMEALQQANRWRLEDEELVLLDDDAELLRYGAASPVGDWQAIGLLQGDAFTSLLEGTEITASFDEDGALSGSAGCNTYNSTYTTEGGTIEVAEPSSTRMACPEPEGVMDQEAAYLAALPTVVGFRVERGVLELLNAEGSAVVSYTSGGTE
ncbi:MAG: META domain-containing protein [Gaiellaceae bacterium]